MGIVLIERQLAMAVIRATWSLTTSMVSGSDCIGIVYAKTDTEIGEMLGTSV